ELLVDDREGEAGGVRPELGDGLEPVEADLGGLLDDRPGKLLPLVPLVRGRTDRLLREAVRPLADVLLILGELEREGRVAHLDAVLLGDPPLDLGVRIGAGRLLFRRHLAQILLCPVPRSPRSQTSIPTESSKMLP